MPHCTGPKNTLPLTSAQSYNMDRRSSDDETRVEPVRATKKLNQSSSFDFDDAFSDGEDDDATFEFSSAAIREEIARNHSWRESENSDEIKSASNGWSEDVHDTSVSTIDIGRRALDSPPPESYAASSRDSELSADDFSQISLSEDSPNPSLQVNPDMQPEDADAEEAAAHPYPAVHIDASEKPSARVEYTNTNTPPDSRVDLPSLEQDMPQTPRSAPASSPQPASSFLPDSSSLSVPDTPTKPAFGHRPTRSAGPSALEKVISKTRPSFLPPKNKLEDNKHMADWEKMMKQSRAAGRETYSLFFQSYLTYFDRD